MPDRFQLFLAQAALAQMLQRQQIGVAGQDVAARAMQRIGGRRLQLAANLLRLVERRVQAVVGQRFELSDEVLDLCIGGPERFEAMPTIKLG